jgi:hypothetical protein
MKNMPLVALLCAALSPAVAMAAEKVTLVYEPQTADNTPRRLVSSTCTVALAPVQDGRNNRETIGHEWEAIVADGAVPWVTAAADRLKAYGFDVVETSTPPAGSIGLAPTLIRAYTFHGPMRINGMVALDSRLTLPNGQVEQRKFRASGNKANMAGSASEYVTALNYAINNLMDNVAQQLAPLCPGGALAQASQTVQ